MLSEYAFGESQVENAVYSRGMALKVCHFEHTMPLKIYRFESQLGKIKPNLQLFWECVPKSMPILQGYALKNMPFRITIGED